MAVEEGASSLALSLVDVLESNERKRARVYASAGAGVATIAMWVVHLLYPEVFTFFLELDGWAKLAFGFVLAPPFLTAFGVGTFIFPQPIEPASADQTGPMSTFFYQERSSRRWKLLIAAGLFAAVNFVLILATSGI